RGPGRADDALPARPRPHGSERARAPAAAPLRADQQRRRGRGAGPGAAGGEQAIHAGAGAARDDPGRSPGGRRRGIGMNDPSSDRDPFEVVAESFLARFRAGERPSIEDLAARYPELAGPIRKLLPALVRVERDLSVDPDS